MPSNGNKFKNACFISYKHPPKTAREANFYREFVEAFQERLEFYLSTDIRTYVDLNADPASSYPAELPQQLCGSVCMIAVLVPEYPDSNWCQAEWDAMERFEVLRLGEGKRGLIIPIALRRPPDEWNARYRRKPIDFSKVSVPNQLKGVKHSEKIQQIADMIQKLVEEVKETCEDCGKFQFDLREEMLNLNPAFKDPEL
jgi:hypothetical protein